VSVEKNTFVHNKIYFILLRNVRINKEIDNRFIRTLCILNTKIIHSTVGSNGGLIYTYIHKYIHTSHSLSITEWASQIFLCDTCVFPKLLRNKEYFRPGK
jgi:hypothetical protein